MLFGHSFRKTIALLAVAFAGEYMAVAQPTAFEVIKTFPIGGQAVTVTRIGAMHRLTSRITSCGQGVLYSTRTDGTLWVNLKGGAPAEWKRVNAGTQGVKIACDRINLYSLNPNGSLYHANVRTDGQLDTIDRNDPSVTQVWRNKHDGKDLAVPTGTDEIQGGMGNIYALVFDSGAGTLYSSELRQGLSPSGYAQGSAGSWVRLAGDLGTHLATGAGSRAMFTAFTSGLGYRKANRAFGVNPDSTLYYNDTLLDGQNFWTQFDNAGLAIESITADSSNQLYAVVKKESRKQLVSFSFVESNCRDNLDNDANGRIDAEDANCRGALARSWCQSHTGSYCIDRLQSTEGYTHALVTCNSGGRPPTVRAGLCTKVTSGNDHLTPARANNEPLGAGHYCNIINPDGSWDFKYTGPKPCALLQDKHPQATVVRAGIYSTTALNYVHVRCTNGGVTFDGMGTAPLESALNGVNNTRNRCVFTVSPKAMQVFNAPFPTSVWRETLYGGRGYRVGHMFDHAPKCNKFDPGCPCTTTLECPVSLADFGNGETGDTAGLDNRGRTIDSAYNNQNSYDFVMNEGTPLRSLGWGRVVGSRDRDLSSQGLGGTTYQGEIYIRYDIGEDPVYAESFIAYYAHVGKRVVEVGQTVAPGQLIGYVGTTGSSSEPHVHFGLIRLSNTNGRTRLGGEAFGWHVPFSAVLTNDYGVNLESMPGLIDPYGWRAPAGIDPMGYHWSNAITGLGGVIGIGAWSPQMWIPSEVPPYPPK